MDLGSLGPLLTSCHAAWLLRPWAGTGPWPRVEDPCLKHQLSILSFHQLLEPPFDFCLCGFDYSCFNLLLLCRSVVSDSLWPHGLQHARLPCPSQSSRACSNSCPLNQWCHPTVSSSVIPFSSCRQSFPASGSFPMSRIFTSGGQSIGASASPSVLSMNVQGLLPLGPITLGAILSFPGGSVVKNLPANAGGVGFIPGLGRSLGEGNHNRLQYSCLGNPMDREAWRVTVHGVAKESMT